MIRKQFSVQSFLSNSSWKQSLSSFIIFSSFSSSNEYHFSNNQHLCPHKLVNYQLVNSYMEILSKRYSEFYQEYQMANRQTQKLSNLFSSTSIADNHQKKDKHFTFLSNIYYSESTYLLKAVSNSLNLTETLEEELLDLKQRQKYFFQNCIFNLEMIKVQHTANKSLACKVLFIFSF